MPPRESRQTVLGTALRAVRWRAQRALRLWVLALILCVTAARPGVARAQSAPDVSPLASLEGVLPDAPAAFVSRTESGVRWDYPEAAAGVVEPLIPLAAREWARVEAELGVDVADDLLIRVGREPEEMRALAPIGSPPPDYASGVAYPAAGLILLTLSAPETWDRPDVARVLAHELSHVALHRAAGGRAMPRWFDEGLAIQFAGEHDLERVRVLWQATAGGSLLSLDELSQRFPTRAHGVHLAYAESADFVSFLHGRDEARFTEMLGRIERGASFESAVSLSYDHSVWELEREWREGLEGRFGLVPLLLGSGFLWVALSLILVYGYFRRRRKQKKTLTEWGKREDEEDRAEEESSQVLVHVVPRINRRIGAPGARLHDGGDPTPPDPGEITEPLDEVEGDDTWPPAQRDESVPKIHVDGRPHTLH